MVKTKRDRSIGRCEKMRESPRGKRIPSDSLSGADTKPLYYVSTCTFFLVSPQGLGASGRVTRAYSSLPVCLSFPRRR